MPGGGSSVQQCVAMSKPRKPKPTEDEYQKNLCPWLGRVRAVVFLGLPAVSLGVTWMKAAPFTLPKLAVWLLESVLGKHSQTHTSYLFIFIK